MKTGTFTAVTSEKMSSMFLIASIALCLWNGQGTLAIVQWDRETVEVIQGDDLTLTCTATDLGLLDVVRLSREDASGAELDIADNEDLKSQFPGRTRLKVQYNPDKNGSATSVLQYQGIRGEDAGTIHCYRLDDESNSDSLILTVLVPVDSLKFSTISKDGTEKIVEDNDDIILVENVSTGLACIATVNGSLTAPAVTISVNSEDKSHLFTPAEQSRDIISDAGPGYFFSEKKLTYHIHKPNPAWNDAKLVCKARQNGFADVTAMVFLRVQYRPVVTCSKPDEYAKVGDSVTLTCKVAANPSSTIVWTRNDEETLIEDSNSFLSETVIKPDITLVSLNFIAINDAHFSKYTIAARNDHGQGKGDIELHQLTSSDIKEHTSGHVKSRGAMLSNIGMRTSTFALLGIISPTIRTIMNCA